MFNATVSQAEGPGVDEQLPIITPQEALLSSASCHKRKSKYHWRVYRGWANPFLDPQNGRTRIRLKNKTLQKTIS